MENFLKIEEGVSPTELRNPSNRTYLGTYKRWMVGSVIALCFIFPAVALLRSQATPERNADNNAGTSQFIAARPLGLGQARVSPLHAYVPSGMSKEEYAKLKKKEADAKKNKNFGAGGARGFEPIVRELSGGPRAWRSGSFVPSGPEEGCLWRNPTQGRALHAARWILEE
jgi:hypothetical protein